MSDFLFSKPKLLEKIESGEKYDRNEAWMMQMMKNEFQMIKKHLQNDLYKKIKVFKNFLNFDQKS